MKLHAVPVLAGLLVLFLAYVAGRAVGILLDTNPYVTEAVAMLIAVAWLVKRRGA